MIRLLLLFFLVFQHGETHQGKYFFTNSGKVSFRSEASQELIKASSQKLNGLLDSEKKTFAFKVDIQSFDGFNNPVQKTHFNEKYMESEKYPEAIFNGKIIEDINMDQDGTTIVRAKGKLTVHGKEQERIIKASIQIHGEQAHIESHFTILLADHNIKVPRVVHEKIATEIAVDITADLKRKQIN